MLLYMRHSGVLHRKCQSEEPFQPGRFRPVKSARSKRNDRVQHVMICAGGSAGLCVCGCQCSQVRKRQFGWDFLLSVENGYDHKECCVTWATSVLLITVSNSATMQGTHSIGSFTFGGGWNRSLFCYKAVNMIWNANLTTMNYWTKTSF